MELYLRHLQQRIHRALDPLHMKLHHQISVIQAVSDYIITRPHISPIAHIPNYPINSQGIVVEENEIILGYELALSSDGSILAVGGYNLVRDFSFVKGL